MKKEKNELYVQIGGRIRECRDRLGLTQEKLSEEVDVTVQYISDLERGCVGTKLSTMIKLCRALQTSSDYILMGYSSDYPYSDTIMQIQSLTDEEKSIIDKGIMVLLEACRHDTNNDTSKQRDKQEKP